MTIHERVTYTLTVVGLIAVGAVLMTLSWFAPGVTSEPQPLLMLAGSCALGVAGLGLLSAAAHTFSRVEAHVVCSYCRTAVPEAQAYRCAGQRWACDDCCARDGRVVTLPDEVA